MALRIGITGNIGAGKTTVCREFERLGVPVYYADPRAKQLMNEHTQLRGQIIATFGKQAYTSEGVLDRDYLGKLAFADPAALDALNALVHPVVAADADSWHAAQSAPYTLHEAAILYEIGATASYRAIVVVACPLPLRKQRVLKRDRLTSEAFEQRAARQWSDDKKEAAADYLIQNDGRALLLPQLLALDRQLRALSPLPGR